MESSPPLVSVRYNLNPVFGYNLLTSLGPALCLAVAKHFDCGGEWSLTPKDIEVRFTQASPFDVSLVDVAIDLELDPYTPSDMDDSDDGRPVFDSKVNGLKTDIVQMLPKNMVFSLGFKLNNTARFRSTR